MTDGVLFLLCFAVVAALPVALLVAVIRWLNRH